MRLVNGTGAFGLGHTHSNHPVGAAAANAVPDVLEQDQLIQRASQLGQELQERLTDMCHHHRIVGDVRGAGKFLGLELVDPANANRRFTPRHKVAARAIDIAFELGLILYPASGFAGALGGDAVIIAPPLNISASEVNLLLTTLGKVLTNLEETLNQKPQEIKNTA
jgi:adenosylmethionine-8-amino-7-oxononanoate aminotransferase